MPFPGVPGSMERTGVCLSYNLNSTWFFTKVINVHGLIKYFCKTCNEKPAATYPLSLHS